MVNWVGSLGFKSLYFLLEKEYNVSATGGILDFTPYKAGPYSSKLYDSLEYLENLGYIRGEIVGEAVQEEALEIDALNFEDLIETEKPASDSYVERSFSLTSKGVKKVEELVLNDEYTPIVNKIRKVKSKYASYSLRDLLYYVYSKYPEMTTESEIKGQVLGERLKQ